jgi:hypothetical protein
MQIVEQCRSHYGDLSDRNRALLKQLLVRPNSLAWSQARKIVISPLPITNVEMALGHIGYTNMQQCPDPFTLYRAIRQTLRRHERFVENPEAFDIES